MNAVLGWNLDLLRMPSVIFLYNVGSLWLEHVKRGAIKGLQNWVEKLWQHYVSESKMDKCGLKLHSKLKCPSIVGKLTLGKTEH